MFPKQDNFIAGIINAIIIEIVIAAALLAALKVIW